MTANNTLEYHKSKNALRFKRSALYLSIKSGVILGLGVPQFVVFAVLGG